jgi:hypothetical protein
MGNLRRNNNAGDYFITELYGFRPSGGAAPSLSSSIAPTSSRPSPGLIMPGRWLCTVHDLDTIFAAMDALRPLGFLHSYASIDSKLHRVYQLHSYHLQRPSRITRNSCASEDQAGFRDFIVLLDSAQIYVDPYFLKRTYPSSLIDFGRMSDLHAENRTFRHYIQSWRHCLVAKCELQGPSWVCRHFLFCICKPIQSLLWPHLVHPKEQVRQSSGDVVIKTSFWSFHNALHAL